MSFSGKTVLVTGAAAGIGRATALRFDREGAEVVIADINGTGLRETASLMTRAPRIAPYDAMDLASCTGLVDLAAQNGLDVLCNIAGMMKWGPTLEFASADFETILKVNTTSTFVLCQAALPHLLRTRGNIVNMASTAGLQGMAYTVAYAASKHAVVGMTKSLAVEFAGDGVRVNAICPGHVNTAMGNAAPPDHGVNWDLVMRNAPKLAEGICEPEDIAELVSYLASERARRVTGSIFNIDGGQLAG